MGAGTEFTEGPRVQYASLFGIFRRPSEEFFKWRVLYVSALIH